MGMKRTFIAIAALAAMASGLGATQAAATLKTPSFFEGKVHDLARPGLSLARRMDLAASEAEKSAPRANYFNLRAEQYKAKRKGDGVSERTVNLELACLKTMMTKAVDWDKLRMNPVSKVRKFREAPARERILSADEARRLVEFAGPGLRPVLVIALNTGMRRGEILGLRWSDVDMVKGFILIGDSKSGKSRKIPMNGAVLEALAGLRQRGEFVFQNGSADSHVLDVKTAFHGACRRAGIKALRFHDLRHTAASRMVAAGIDLVTVSKILGHSSITMTMRYAHPTPENMRQAVQKLGEFFESGGVTPDRASRK